MKTADVEIYSDASNMVVMRHPDRHFPGVLIQGDTLSGLVSELAVVLSEKAALSEDAAGELEDVHERLSDMLAQYTAVLEAHGIELPFSRRVGG